MKSIEFEGMTFKSIEALCEHYDVGYNAFRQRLKRGYTVEEALKGTFEKSTFEKGTHCNDGPFEFEDKTYKNLQELAKAYNVSYHTLCSRHSHGWDLKSCVYGRNGTAHKPIDLTKKVIDFNDKHFDNLSAFCKFYGLDYKSTSKYLRNGHTLAECVAELAPKQAKEIVYIVFVKSNNSIIAVYKDGYDAARCCKYYKDEMMWDTTVVKYEVQSTFKT